MQAYPRAQHERDIGPHRSSAEGRVSVSLLLLCEKKIFVRLCVVFPPSVSHISAVNHAHERIGIMRTMI